MTNKTMIPPTEVNFEPLVTRLELAEILRVSGRTIARLVAAHQLPEPIQVGARWRWLARDVNAFIQNKTDNS